MNGGGHTNVTIITYKPLSICQLSRYMPYSTYIYDIDQNTALVGVH